MAARRSTASLVTLFVSCKVSRSKLGIQLVKLPFTRSLVQAKAMHPAPELVYRRMHFHDGIPAEYLWATTSPDVRSHSDRFVERLSMPSGSSSWKQEQNFSQSRQP